MARGRREIPPCCKTYGFPLFCAACVPVDRIENGGGGGDLDQGREEEPPKPSPAPPISDRLLVALGGGGGEGRSGVPNALVLSAFDFASRSMSDHPVCRLGTEGEAPYRMAMHPGGEGFVCSFPTSCRWFEWDFSEKKEPLTMKSSEKILTNLEDVGMQLALAFNSEGSILAAGGEDGYLRVFKWPSMEVIIDQKDAHTTIKDLSFSLDAKYLVSLDGSGPCRVWDLETSASIASLTKEDGEMFRFCRFSQGLGEDQAFYCSAMHGDYGKIISWNVGSWERIWSKRIVRDPISAFNVSHDGKLLAIGTAEGNLVIIKSSNMQPLTTVKAAHLGLVTSVVFSQDSRALVSTSFDSTARVTLIESKTKNGINTWLVVLTILLALFVYYYTTSR